MLQFTVSTSWQHGEIIVNVHALLEVFAFFHIHKCGFSSYWMIMHLITGGKKTSESLSNLSTPRFCCLQHAKLTSGILNLTPSYLISNSSDYYFCLSLTFALRLVNLSWGTWKTYLFTSVNVMGDSFVLFDVSMEIHHVKITLGNGKWRSHTICEFPEVKSPFTTVKGRCVTAANDSACQRVHPIFSGSRLRSDVHCDKAASAVCFFKRNHSLWSKASGILALVFWLTKHA